MDVRQVSTELEVRRIMVTHSAVLGETVGELGLRERLHVNVTRLHRSGVEMPPLNAQFFSLATC